MQTAKDRRRTRFLKRLEAEGKTQSSWAAENGITKGHLSLVLHGKRESDTLAKKIDEYAKSA